MSTPVSIFRIVVLVSPTLWAQLATGVMAAGVIEGIASPDARVSIRGELWNETVRADSRGRFTAVVPYGWYRVSSPPDAAGVRLFVPALATVRVKNPMWTGTPWIDATWIDTARGDVYPEPHSLAAILLSRDPASVAAPLNFTGLFDGARAVESSRGIAWTGTEYRLDGINATDSYQPGRPAILPDVDALDEIAVREAFSAATSGAFASEVNAFVATPENAWHGAISTSDTGAILSASNLPPPPDRGIVEQTERFRWFTQEEARLGGPVSNRADIFAAIAGEWSRQTVGIGGDQGGRLLYATAQARVRATDRDRFDALYTGTRVGLSNYANPAGIEAVEGRADAPSFVLPVGFAGQSEADRMDFWQAGWLHTFASSLLEVRFGDSITHFDTATPAEGRSVVELLDGAVTGAPPIGNFAVRPRETVAGSWQTARQRHRIAAGGEWNRQSPENRFTAPSNMNLITANGAPAFAVVYNTPAETTERIESGNLYIADHVQVADGLSIDAALLGDFARGGPVEWSSAAPRAGLAWRVPHASRLTLLGTYLRSYAPLGGRDLDFANPDSLSGSEYAWSGGDDLGEVIERFGGAYSSIAPNLRRPDADEFDAGATLQVARGLAASVQLFRRDEKNRLAAIDVGIPASAFTPVTIAPGVVAYNQNPATFGDDRYLLTNPPGLREQYSGMVARISGEWRGLSAGASFAAEKSFGPTNPGDAFFENDPGVVGALFLNPNETVNVDNRDFMDRGYVGKVQATYTLPWKIEIATVADYLDGLVFAEQLLVTGLAQGPVMIAATVRGSPEGGNRAEYVLNWNFRVQRGFAMRRGRMVAGMGLFNATNGSQRIQESDVGSAAFLLRLPVAIQEPRSARALLRFEF